VICLTGWMACVLWPKILTSLGLAAYGMTYLDSYAILAAVTCPCRRASYVVNRWIPRAGGTVYSDWWLRLRWLGAAARTFFLVACSGRRVWLSLLAGGPARNLRGSGAGWRRCCLSPPGTAGLPAGRTTTGDFVLIALSGLGTSG